VTVTGARQVDMMTFLNVFRAVGGAFEVTDAGIRFWHPGGELRAVAIETDVHPGFMTDWQQPLVVALTQARGLSIVHETVYERRFGYVDALNTMGATIQVYRECLGARRAAGAGATSSTAVIAGPSKLHAADLVVPDLRAGFSHLIAALAAEGTSGVRRTPDQPGYEDFEAKLAGLGAHVELSAGSVTLSGALFRRKSAELVGDALADGRRETAPEPVAPTTARRYTAPKGRQTPKRGTTGRRVG
jgi:UDP-N-acetylglucosamine 1-carboxyvinyltransferase